MDERCPPADYDRILAWLRARYYGGWGLGLIGGLVWLGALVLVDVPPVRDPAVFAYAGAGLVLHTAGVALYARSKGLSWGWAAMSLGCFFGWLVLAWLPKRCRYCGTSPAGRGLDCRCCGGPI